MKWIRLLAMATIGYAIWRVARWADTTDPDYEPPQADEIPVSAPPPAPAPEPPPPPEPAPADSFFALDRPAQLKRLIAMFNGGGDTYALWQEAARLNRKPELLELAVHLVGVKDPDMMANASDTLTTYTPGEPSRSELINQRIDDSLFKESLLYFVRDNLPPESPLLDTLFEAFDDEPYEMTRMRIVRAIGTVGGPRARGLLKRVLAAEGGFRTPAAQEAERRLRS